MSSNKLSRVSLQNLTSSKLLIVIIVSLTVFSYIVSITAFVSPSQEQRWDTSLETIIPTNYHASEDVTLTGYLTEGTEYISSGAYFSFTNPETITWIVTIIDPVSTPVYYIDGVITDAQGDIQLNPLTYTIPPSPRLGTYTVKVFVITNYLPTGDLRVNLVNEATFKVV